MRFHAFRPLRGAFSLIELIVVIAIIGIVAVFVVPAANTIIMGTDITRGSQALASQLALARQTAVTTNHPVEVRFLKYANPEMPGEDVKDQTTWKFRAMVLLEIFDNGNTALLGKVERLPGNIMMDPANFSSLLRETPPEGGSGGSTSSEAEQKLLKIIAAGDRKDSPPIPGLPKDEATNYKYVSFRFLPDGSTNLDPNGNWYVTIYSAVDVPKLPKTGKPEINYFTAQVDPVSGAVRTFRPTAGSKEVGGTTGT